MAKSEHDVELAIMAWMNMLPRTRICKNSKGRNRGIPYGLLCAGSSDLIGVSNGRFVAIEVKAPGKLKTLRSEQKAYILDVEACGGIAFAADSLEMATEEFGRQR